MDGPLKLLKIKSPVNWCQFNLYKTTLSMKAHFLIWKFEACYNKDKLVIENSVSGRSVLGQSCFRLKYIWAEVSMGPKYYWGWSILWAEVCHICLGPMWVRGLSGLWAKLGMSLLSDFLTEIYLFITPQVLLYFRGRSVTTLPNASTQ